MTEGQLKSKLVETMRGCLPKFVILRHEDKTLHGVPDLSVTGSVVDGHGGTTWWEVKHATPDFKSEKIQDATMYKLAREGFARYIIFRETASGALQHVVIAHPKDVFDFRTGQRTYAWKALDPLCPEYNMEAICKHIYRAHFSLKRA